MRIFVRLSKRDRRVELTTDLTPDEIAAVERSEMKPGIDYLNDEFLTGNNAAG
jgi:hypothetical protein